MLSRVSRHRALAPSKEVFQSQFSLACHVLSVSLLALCAVMLKLTVAMRLK